MWLRERRKSIGIETLEELARLLQLQGFAISPSALSHYEQGRRSIPLDDDDFRNALMRVLKYSESELMRAAGFEIGSDLTEDGQRAAEIIEKLPPDARIIAMDILHSFERHYA
jgi:transcriptional regulator with XRE-family HTH domain